MRFRIYSHRNRQHDLPCTPQKKNGKIDSKSVRRALMVVLLNCWRWNRCGCRVNRDEIYWWRDIVSVAHVCRVNRAYWMCRAVSKMNIFQILLSVFLRIESQNVGGTYIFRSYIMKWSWYKRIVFFDFFHTRNLVLVCCGHNLILMFQILQCLFKFLLLNNAFCENLYFADYKYL